MTRGRYQLPAASALAAFEATARLGSITLAAEERATSHSAVSRHIRTLERDFGAKLFERRGRGVVLTYAGEAYFAAVQRGLDLLDNAGHALRHGRQGLAIGCTVETSVLFLQPVFPALQRALGDGVAARVLAYDPEALPMSSRVGLDIVIEAREPAHHDPLAVPLLREEVVPVADAAFARRHDAALRGDPAAWAGVPRLETGRPAPAWATWGTWFAAHGCEPPPAPVVRFENYLNLLRAAQQGEGLALGWNGFLDDDLRSGRLVAVRDGWLPTRVFMYAVPTPVGKGKAGVAACLAELRALAEGLRLPTPPRGARRAEAERAAGNGAADAVER